MTAPQGLHGVKLHLVETWDDAQDFMRWLSEDRGRTWLAEDIETEGFDWWRQKIRLVQIGDAHEGWALPWERWSGLAADAFQRVKNVRWVAHNWTFESIWLEHHGVTPPTFDDTMPMVFLIESEFAKGLKAAAARRVDRRARSAEYKLKQALAKAHWNWATVPINFEPYWAYAALDTVLTAALAEDAWPEVERSYRDAYYLQLESDAVLLKMQRRGMRIDVAYCMREKAKLDARLNEIVTIFKEEHGVDVFSSTQLVRFFWSQGIELQLTTKGGAPSVSKDSLALVDHPLVDLILEARKCQIQANTFFGNMLEYATDDLLHPNINPLGAKTGRQSINRPSLQNQPRNSLVRDSFIPREGNKLVLCDFQGQEMRVFAHFCQDPEMLAAYRRGEDLHNFASKELFGPDFTRKQRQKVKNGGFSKIYGAGDEKSAATVGVPLSEWIAFKQRYDLLFPGANRFMARCTQVALQRSREAGTQWGWVTTLGGRRVAVPRGKAYVSVNYLVQGSCADILRESLVNLDNAGLTDYIVLPVHDETVFDVPEAEAEDLAYEVARVMEKSAFNISVPMVVETKILDRWGDAYREAA